MKKFKTILLFGIFIFSQTGVQAAEKSELNASTVVDYFAANFVSGIVGAIIALDQEVKKSVFIEQEIKVIKTYFEPITEPGRDFLFKNSNSIFSCQDLHTLIDGRFSSQTKGESSLARVKRVYGMLQLIFLLEQSFINEADFSSTDLSDSEKSTMADNFIFAFLEDKNKSEAQLFQDFILSIKEENIRIFQEEELNCLEVFFQEALKRSCLRMIQKKIKLKENFLNTIEEYFEKGYIPQDIIENSREKGHVRIDALNRRYQQKHKKAEV